MREIVKKIAHLFFAGKPKPRKIRRGLAKGAVAKVDFRYDMAFFMGNHEPDLYPHYRRLLKPGMRCFDVGMYRGWDALQLGFLTGAAVVSFDGAAKCIDMARDFLSPSGVKATLVQAYLTDGSNGDDTLDKEAERHFTPDFMKIDVEGAEAMVLKGGRHILTDRHPSLVIETHNAPVEQECIDLLKSLNYEPIVVDRSAGMFSEARSLQHNRWLVCEGKT